MPVKIALAGNPNCGKTTLFNELTGSSQYVGNWPGVTVEKKEGRLTSDKDVTIQDLPGIYSLSPYTLEEVVARGYLIKEKPDVILNIVDATNLERNLYLTMQLMEIGLPMVIALNMMDLVRKNGDIINAGKLEQELGCPVVSISALKSEATHQAASLAVWQAQGKTSPRLPALYGAEVEQAIARIEALLEGRVPGQTLHWYAIKAFERDEKVMQEMELDEQTLQRLEGVIAGCEEALDDDSQSIITGERYAFIAKVMDACVKKTRGHGQLSPSDRIDRVVTNRFFALPIFACVMILVYYVSISSVGDYLTGFVGDTLFGQWISVPLQGWLEAAGTAPWLVGLVIDGIVAGVGAVLSFVPQMMILFFFLAVLEDVGYMARVAFIMDRIFRKFGLSGKSFIPMLIGSGCGVPGIMASRTIENDRDRKMTILTTTFIPCGAKMPIVALIAGALFGGAWWVAPSAYFIGVAAVVFSGIILKKTSLFAGEAAPFVMELPAYHIPSAKNVFKSMWERGFSFIKRAGTVILVSSVLIWLLSSFGAVDGGLRMVEDMDASLLAALGGVLAPVFAPLGFGTWQSATATVMGLLAKEEVVSVFGVLHGGTGDALVMASEGTYAGLGSIASHFTALSGYSFLVFNLLCAPCFAAMGAIRREMANGKWTAFAISYQCVFAYIVSLCVYQLGLWIQGGTFVVRTGAAMVLAALLLGLLVCPNRAGKARAAKAVRA